MKLLKKDGQPVTPEKVDRRQLELQLKKARERRKANKQLERKK